MLLLYMCALSAMVERDAIFSVCVSTYHEFGAVELRGTIIESILNYNCTKNAKMNMIYYTISTPYNIRFKHLPNQKQFRPSHARPNMDTLYKLTC